MSHGGNIYRAMIDYNLKEDEILDFSANINPLGVPEILKTFILDNIDTLVNYPDPQCNELRSDISNYLDIPADQVFIGNGASEVIFQLFEILKFKKVLIPAPTFSEYSSAAIRYGTHVEYFRLEEEYDFNIDTEILIEKMSQGFDAVLLCNPNNPTSTLINKQDLLKIIEYAQKNNILVIIDEAFIELTVGSNQNSVSDQIKNHDNLFIIRAFTKVFAIPGLRLGYGLGSRELIQKMWDKKLPWSVNTMACLCGRLFNAGNDYLKETEKWLKEEKNWLYHELKKINQIKIFQPQTNFILIKVLDDKLNSTILKDQLASKGVLIRDASNFEFLSNRFIRVAIKDRNSNIQLVRMLKEFLI